MVSVVFAYQTALNILEAPMRFFITAASLAAFSLLSANAEAQKAYTVTQNVDTGSHTCTSQGQDYKVYAVAEAPPDRFFVESTVSYTEVSRFGEGNCVYTNDGGGTIEKKTVTLKLANGQTVRADVPVKYFLRAYADCTNNLAKLGTRVGTECKFKGETDRFE